MAYASPLSNAPVITSDEDTRAAFLVRVYQHVALAVAAFIAIETVLYMSGIAETMLDFFARSGGAAWLLLLGGFTIVNVMASKSAHNLSNPAMQYAGLFGMAAAQAVIFAPFLYLVFQQDGGATDVTSAAVVSLLGFAALTVIGMVTRKDLSFMRPILMFAGVMALVAIVGAVIFGAGLGLWFSVAMVALAGGNILYQTQTIIRTYPAWAHVGAAVGLFASLMMMFWYVLRIFSRR